MIDWVGRVMFWTLNKSWSGGNSCTILDLEQIMSVLDLIAKPENIWAIRWDDSESRNLLIPWTWNEICFRSALGCTDLCCNMVHSQAWWVRGVAGRLCSFWKNLDCRYAAALASRIDKIIGLFCKTALSKGRYSATETYNFIDATDRSHSIDYIPSF